MAVPLNKPPGHFDRFNFCIATDQRGAVHLDIELFDGGGVRVYNASQPFAVGPLGVRVHDVCQGLNVVRVKADVQLDDGKLYRLDYTRDPADPAFIAGVVGGLERECSGTLHPFALIMMDDGKALGVEEDGSLRIV
jgi:hypothetical protein